METKHIEVTRPICIGGERVEPGTVLEVSPALAAELCGMAKAVPAEDKAKTKAKKGAEES